MPEQEMTEQELEAARVKLDKLARKLGVFIGGCGCCGSPYLCSDDCKTSIDDVVIGGKD